MSTLDFSQNFEIAKRELEARVKGGIIREHSKEEAQRGACIAGLEDWWELEGERKFDEWSAWRTGRHAQSQERDGKGYPV